MYKVGGIYHPEHDGFGGNGELNGEASVRWVLNQRPNLTNKWIAARYMMLSGFASSIVMIETGLIYTKISRLYQELEYEGHELKRKYQPIKKGHQLINSHMARIQASVLVQLYLCLNNDVDIKDAISIRTLYQAYRMYHAIRNEVIVKRKANWLPFNITDAWCLLKEMQDGEATIKKYKPCKCHVYNSIHQRTYIDCPFCRRLKKSDLR